MKKTIAIAFLIGIIFLMLVCQPKSIFVEEEVITKQIVVLEEVIEQLTVIEEVPLILYEPKFITAETFNITHYCACEICCGKWADGMTKTNTVATEGRTIAVDPLVIPLGSKVYIEDVGIFIAEDTGNPDPEFMSGNRIDIYIDDHERALELGRYEARVWVLE